jgi:Na+/proline symporter
VADTAGDSVVAAHMIAERTGSADLAASANSAYVHGMGVALLVCGIAALVSALLAAAFLPGTPPAGTPEGAPDMVAPVADARQ